MTGASESVEARATVIAASFLHHSELCPAAHDFPVACRCSIEPVREQVAAKITAIVADAVRAELDWLLSGIESGSPCSLCGGTGKLKGASFANPGERLESSCSACHGRGRLRANIGDALDMIRARRKEPSGG